MKPGCKNVWCLVVAVVALILSGCTAVLVGGAAAGGAGAMAYVRGELKTTLDASLPDVCKAVDRAASELALKAESVAEDGLESKRLFRTAAGKKVIVRLKRLGDRSTEIGIRVGTFGDQSLSEQFLAKIRSQL